MENNELTHHGILGMKWGVRRTPAQLGHKTGSSTKNKLRSINEKTNDQIKKIKAQSKAEAKIAKAQRKADDKIAKAESKYLKKHEDPKPEKKSIKDMTDDEIRAKINRLRLEEELKRLSPEPVSRGKKFLESLSNDVIKPSAKAAGKALLTKALTKFGSKFIDKAAVKDIEKELSSAKKDAEKEIKKAKDKESNQKDKENKADKPKNKEDKKSKEKAQSVYGEVIGEGTSSKNRSTPFDRDYTDFVDVDYWSDIPVSSPSTSLVVSRGRNYIDDRYLIERR